MPHENNKTNFEKIIIGKKNACPVLPEQTHQNKTKNQL
jgi:hypothetical protein